MFEIADDLGEGGEYLLGRAPSLQGVVLRGLLLVEGSQVVIEESAVRVHQVVVAKRVEGLLLLYQAFKGEHFSIYTRNNYY